MLVPSSNNQDVTSYNNSCIKAIQETETLLQEHLQAAETLLKKVAANALANLPHPSEETELASDIVQSSSSDDSDTDKPTSAGPTALENRLIDLNERTSKVLKRNLKTIKKATEVYNRLKDQSPPQTEGREELWDNIENLTSVTAKLQDVAKEKDATHRENADGTTGLALKRTVAVTALVGLPLLGIVGLNLYAGEPIAPAVKKHFITVATFGLTAILFKKIDDWTRALPIPEVLKTTSRGIATGAMIVIAKGVLHSLLQSQSTTVTEHERYQALYERYKDDPTRCIANCGR